MIGAAVLVVGLVLVWYFAVRRAHESIAAVCTGIRGAAPENSRLSHPLVSRTTAPEP